MTLTTGGVDGEVVIGTVATIGTSKTIGADDGVIAAGGLFTGQTTSTAMVTTSTTTVIVPHLTDTCAVKRMGFETGGNVAGAGAGGSGSSSRIQGAGLTDPSTIHAIKGSNRAGLADIKVGGTIP